jgi:2-oxoisovalerate dehydrogenase E1 component alpha subunit
VELQAVARTLVPSQAGELIRLIEPDGSPNTEAGYDPSPAQARLEELYEAMVATRGLDDELMNLQRQGELALYPPCRGQEAAQVGATAALRPGDWLFPQYRELGAFVVRGVPPEGVGLMWRGTWHSAPGLIERNIAPMSIPIGTQAPHAVGAAMAARWLGEDSVTVAFIGDGATSEGDVHEALNLAAVQRAPCIFFLQNNGWAISVPVSEQTRAPTLAHKGIGYGMPAVRVDGNDVVACHAVVSEAAARARAGDGPTLIEAVTYRMGPHTTSDDPTRYRSDEEIAAWVQLDPIERCRRHLQWLGSWRPELDERAQERANVLRERLRAAVVDAPDPAPSELFAHVLGAPTPDLMVQRAALLAEFGRET